LILLVALADVVLTAVSVGVAISIDDTVASQDI